MKSESKYIFSKGDLSRNDYSIKYKNEKGNFYICTFGLRHGNLRRHLPPSAVQQYRSQRNCQEGNHLSGSLGGSCYRSIFDGR